MSEVPQVLLEKRVTIGSLFKNLICQLSIKSQVTHHSRVTEKKTNIANGLKHQSNKQIALTSANDTYLWCPSMALASNFSMWLSPLSQSLLV